MMEPGNASVGATTPREAVGFFGEAHHFAVYSKLFEGDEGLFPLFDGAAEVVFAVDDQGRGFGVADIFHRGSIPRDIHILVGGDVPKCVLETPIEVA